MRAGNRRVIAFVVLWAAIWAAQLLLLSSELARPTWSSYWRYRGLYRPGFQLVQAHAADQVPGKTFNPLSPSGARLAFILASGVYAMLAAAATVLAIWAARRLLGPRRPNWTRPMLT